MKSFFQLLTVFFTVLMMIFLQTGGVSAQAPAEPSQTIQSAQETDRGRVQIIDHTVKADNGYPLRGEHLRMSLLPLEDDPTQTNLDRAYDVNVWINLIETFHLNTVRLILYRPPQNWDLTVGLNCPPERCFATVDEALPHLDQMVDIASTLGMYVIIDYHPVGGHVKDDAIAWWSKIAPRYKDRTHVIYELSNEPVMWSAAAYTAEDIQFEQDLYQLIRAAAPDTHIILWTFAESSGDGDNMLTKVQSAQGINYVNASVGFHPYRYNASAPEVETLQNAGFAVFDTEIGQDADYDETTVREEANGISWVWLDATGFEKPTNFSPPPVTWPRDPATRTGSNTDPLLQVAVQAGQIGPLGLTNTFVAQVSPSTAQTPITYTWHIQNHGELIERTTINTADVLQYTWHTTGTKTVTVTVENAHNQLVDIHTIQIKPFDCAVYLPVVLKKR